MNLPSDPYMLLSIINMKLRDEFPNLSSLCRGMDMDEPELIQALKKSGFEYNPDSNSFIQM